jgi:predicted metal-dependent phosphotriesterase family hydrolase
MDEQRRRQHDRLPTLDDVTATVVRAIHIMDEEGVPARTAVARASREAPGPADAEAESAPNPAATQPDVSEAVRVALRIVKKEGIGAREALEKALKKVPRSRLRPEERQEAVEAAFGKVGIGPAGTTAVLLALLVPLAMIGGVRGQLYRHFALTVAVAAVLWLVQLHTLCPALCGVLLRPTPERRPWYFRAFQQVLEKAKAFQMAIVRLLVHAACPAVILLVALLGWTLFEWIRVPGGFLPREDQGYFVIQAELPEGAGLGRTQRVMDRATGLLLETPGINSVISMAGYSAAEERATANAGTFFVVLEPWRRRRHLALGSDELARQVQRELSRIQEAECFVSLPPPVPGLGRSDGFELQLLDTGRVGAGQLRTVVDGLLFRGGQHAVLAGLRSSMRADAPTVSLEIDRARALRLGVPLDAIAQTLQVHLSSVPVADLGAFGGVYRVEVEASPEHRREIDEIEQLGVRGASGEVIPLRRLVKCADTASPRVIHRFNGVAAARVMGSPSRGWHLPQAAAALESVAGQVIPASIETAWSGAVYHQRAVGRQMLAFLALALVLTFLFVAARVNSWVLPSAVLFSLPLAILGALMAVRIPSYARNAYVELGFMLLVALALKRAIPIVEYARGKRAEGLSLPDAAGEAARFRCGAGQITTFCFLVGLVPLLLAGGAGAAGVRALGAAVFGGTISFAVLGGLFVPVLFCVAQWIEELFAPLHEEPHGLVWLPMDRRGMGLGDHERPWQGPRPSVAREDKHASREGFICTVTGPIFPEKMGTTLPHEHILTDLAGARRASPDRYDRGAVAARMHDYLRFLRISGGRTIVECTSAYQGRDPELLVRLSKEVGVQFLTNTGYCGTMDGLFVPIEARRETADQIAERWLHEWHKGIGRTGIHPGFIKIGVNGSPLSEIDRNLVRAAAIAHLESGLTIASHTPGGQAALEQLDLLEEAGVDAGAFVWMHAQAEPDPELIVLAGKRGAWLEFNGVGPASIRHHVSLIQRMRNEGLFKQVLVSQNCPGYVVGKRGGGKIEGYGHLFKFLIPNLFRLGLTLKHVEQLTVVNPMRAFTVRIRRMAGLAARQDDGTAN